MDITKVRRLTTVPDDFLSKIPASESQVYDKVVELLSRLQIKDGKYVISTANLEIAANISQALREALLSSSYVEAVAEFASEFDQQAAVSNKLFASTFPGFKPSEVAVNLVQIAKRDAIDLLLNRESDSAFVSPLAETITQAVVNGSGYGETLKSIRTFIEGNDKIDGALLRYSKQQAHDTFAVADRSYTSLVSEQLDAEWFFYSGDVIATSRAFCEERHNQYFYYKEIELWGAGKRTEGMSLPQGGTWNGRVPETNSATIYSYAGGINCGHSIIPVSIFSVPLTVIKRNISAGLYEPTAKEAELLEL